MTKTRAERLAYQREWARAKRAANAAPTRTPEERFWKKVQRGDECWLWTASRDQNGYGQIAWQGRPEKAHRVSLMLAGIEVAGKHVHHMCRTRACVRPDHLEALTSQAEHSIKHATGCGRHGQDHMVRVKTGRNVGMRYCAACNREKAAARRAAKRTAA